MTILKFLLKKKKKKKKKKNKQSKPACFMYRDFENKSKICFKYKSYVYTTSFRYILG